MKPLYVALHIPSDKDFIFTSKEFWNRIGGSFIQKLKLRIKLNMGRSEVVEGSTVLYSVQPNEAHYECAHGFLGDRPYARIN